MQTRDPYSDPKASGPAFGTLPDGGDPELRSTDYGDKLTREEARVETHAVSTQYTPDTGRGLRKAAIILVCILVIGFLVVGITNFLHGRALSHDAKTTENTPRTVDVVTALAVGAGQHFSLPAQTEAWNTSTIYARVDGYVAKWLVDIGDSVKLGQVLATIETPDLDAQLNAARAQLKASSAQILVRRAEAEFARTTYERWRDSPKGVVSEQEREEKRAAFDSANAQLKASEAQEALDQAKVDQYQALFQFKQVRAPFNGTITQRLIDIGNLVTAGSTSSTTPLYVVTQNDPMRVMIDVPQSAASELMQGRLPVTVSAGNDALLRYQGKVTRTSESMNVQARTLRVEVDIPNAANTWVPGMYVNASFDLPPRGQVQVPPAALLFRASGPQVAMIDSQGRVVFHPVTIARDDGATVELGTGVKAGDKLILNLSSQIAAGDPVQISRPEGSPSAAPASGG
jgi:RND family efflux transporter MFP subunit